ncbi:hypothetical protein [Marinagarivorans algicola]|uniref:hypothetical protein n=1 Tax=Marinagarivorans algicola TaxID=1513270 RepID=UPI0006B9C513|nr:hypothetical protein [Marinagarivorans algicola]
MKFFCLTWLSLLLIACNNSATPIPDKVAINTTKKANYINPQVIQTPDQNNLNNNANSQQHTQSIVSLIKQSPRGPVRPPQSPTIYNSEAVIPPQCYTKHQEEFNPCMTCHQSYPYGSRPNAMNDGGLQQEYAFSDFGATNRWQNLFEDRSTRIQAISDQEILDYINTDNYSTLIEQLEAMPDWQGPIPKLNDLHLGATAFDRLGIAKDGSRWVAFNYKPLPSTFWPTNGATDDVMIRLPRLFSTTSCNNSQYSRDTYLANLAILEMAIKDLPNITTPVIDENNICQDINNDGIMGKVITLPRLTYFVGAARTIQSHTMLYPKGTEFLHTVRYIGVSAQGDITLPPRMKEVRYMRKDTYLSPQSLLSAYGNEHQEKIEERLPNYTYRQDRGSNNAFGWTLLGFIEAKEGHLRTQNQEETLFCMGCHSTVGATIDQTFAFARKITGRQGWGYINLKGMPDAPTLLSQKNYTTTEDFNLYKTAQSRHSVGEIQHYLEVVGGGDEFRQNPEMQKNWFKEGRVIPSAIEGKDVYTLITPSRRRALALNKAYYTIVQDQDYIHGRDANITPATNVYQKVDENTPVLATEKAQVWDIRLDW